MQLVRVRDGGAKGEAPFSCDNDGALSTKGLDLRGLDVGRWWMVAVFGCRKGFGREGGSA